VSSPVRVLHPITRLIVGGAQENTFFTAARLDRSRFHVEILSGPQTGQEGSLIEAVREAGVPLEILPELVREISPRNDLVALWKLYTRLKTGDFGIVHTHSSKAGILGRIAAWLAGVPVIVHTVHGWSFHDQMSRWSFWAYVMLERLCATFTDALIVVAESDRQKGLRAGIGRLRQWPRPLPQQYHRIRSAIPLEEFDPGLADGAVARRELGIPAGAPVLGNVGRFSPQKNPLAMLRVARMVFDQVPDCRLLLVGDGPLRAEVEALVDDLGLKDRTILTGLRRDVPQVMAAMDVFLLTSLWEGLPRVIPEAMAMGLPVIANRADGTAEAIVHGVTGYLCEPGEISRMAGFGVELLRDPLLRHEMGRRARDFALREFDLSQMILQIEALYADLLASADIGRR